MNGVNDLQRSKTMSKNPKKETIALFVFWIVTCLVITIANKFRSTHIATTSITQDDSAIATTIFVVALFILPMLSRIYRKAKDASLKWLVAVSKILLYFFCIALSIFTIAFIFTGTRGRFA